MKAAMETALPYRAILNETANRLAGDSLKWLREARLAALSRFEELGFPTQRLEEWRSTSVEPIAKTNFIPASPDESLNPAKENLWLADFESYRLVFVNGWFHPELSHAQDLPPGMIVSSLNQALGPTPAPAELGQILGRRPETAFCALNNALFADGAFIFIPPSVKLEKPVHLVFLSQSGRQAGMAHPRLAVVAGANSRATLVEEYQGWGDGIYFTNSVSDILLGENASLEHCQIQQETSRAYHIRNSRVSLGAGSRYLSHAVLTGAALSRNELKVRLNAEGAECELNGLYMVKGRQHVDCHTAVEHLMPHGASRELYKGVLDDQARAVFKGLITVAPSAQKTTASVYNKNLLLSEGGLVNTKPEFRIKANDVQCRHGATVGQISQDALFYLRSRGLGETAARGLLVHAFASEMLDKINLGPLREALSNSFWRGSHES